MSMEINNSYGTYTTSYTNTAKRADSTKESNVTSFDIKA
jgi:hypothetical protein